MSRDQLEFFNRAFGLNNIQRGNLHSNMYTIPVVLGTAHGFNFKKRKQKLPLP